MMLGFERADAGFKVTFVSYLKLSCKIARMKNMSLKQGQFLPGVLQTRFYSLIFFEGYKHFSHQCHWCHHRKINSPFSAPLYSNKELQLTPLTRSLACSGSEICSLFPSGYLSISCAFGPSTKGSYYKLTKQGSWTELPVVLVMAHFTAQNSRVRDWRQAQNFLAHSVSVSEEILVQHVFKINTRVHNSDQNQPGFLEESTLCYLCFWEHSTGLHASSQLQGGTQTPGICLYKQKSSPSRQSSQARGKANIISLLSHW